MSEQGKLVVANIEDGYAHAEPCNHAWRLKDGDTVRMFDPCPVCTQIKAAEDKRGEEVLEMACEEVKKDLEHLALNVDYPNLASRIEKIVHQAYKERFGELGEPK